MDAQLDADSMQPLSFDCPASLLERVRIRYEEPHRHYHTWAHVLACLDGRRRITDAALPEVDMALLFHDAIYEPLAADNEARSGRLLVEEGRRAWMSDDLLQRAQVLVEATRHEHPCAVDSEEACIVLDADLSILGAERPAFAAYEHQVRREFAMIDDDAYRTGRAKVLRGFLSRPTIYATRRGQRLWEGSARRNLEASLAGLVSGVG